MKIIYTSKFFREYKKLSSVTQDKAEKAEEIFRRDPFDSSLKTHKLEGKFGGFWSFSLDYSYRIIFEFGDDQTVYFHSVGNHTIYD